MAPMKTRAIVFWVSLLLWITPNVNAVRDTSRSRRSYNLRRLPSISTNDQRRFLQTKAPKKTASPKGSDDLSEDTESPVSAPTAVTDTPTEAPAGGQGVAVPTSPTPTDEPTESPSAIANVIADSEEGDGEGDVSTTSTSTVALLDFEVTVVAASEDDPNAVIAELTGTLQEYLTQGIQAGYSTLESIKLNGSLNAGRVRRLGLAQRQEAQTVTVSYTNGQAIFEVPPDAPSAAELQALQGSLLDDTNPAALRDALGMNVVDLTLTQDPTTAAATGAGDSAPSGGQSGADFVPGVAGGVAAAAVIFVVIAAAIFSRRRRVAGATSDLDETQGDAQTEVEVKPTADAEEEEDEEEEDGQAVNVTAHDPTDIETEEQSQAGVVITSKPSMDEREAPKSSDNEEPSSSTGRGRVFESSALRNLVDYFDKKADGASPCPEKAQRHMLGLNRRRFSFKKPEPPSEPSVEAVLANSNANSRLVITSPTGMIGTVTDSRNDSTYRRVMTSPTGMVGTVTDGANDSTLGSIASPELETVSEDGGDFYGSSRGNVYRSPYIQSMRSEDSMDDYSLSSANTDDKKQPVTKWISPTIASASSHDEYNSDTESQFTYGNVANPSVVGSLAGDAGQMMGDAAMAAGSQLLGLAKSYSGDEANGYDSIDDIMSSPQVNNKKSPSLLSDPQFSHISPIQKKKMIEKQISPTSAFSFEDAEVVLDSDDEDDDEDDPIRSAIRESADEDTLNKKPFDEDTEADIGLHDLKVFTAELERLQAVGEGRTNGRKLKSSSLEPDGNTLEEVF